MRSTADESGVKVSHSNRVRLDPWVGRTLARMFRDFMSWRPYRNQSWSQEGEDLILTRYFGERGEGRYLDVGAHHPYRFSNTYHFYRKGWVGVNIDATPGSMEPFRRYRPRDHNLEAAVGEVEGTIPFYIFNDPALNGFDDRLARERTTDHGYRILRTIPVRVRPLSALLAGLPLEQEPFDFISIDIEGFDLVALRTFPWHRCRPNLVLVECLGSRILMDQEDPVRAFMYDIGYQIFAKSFATVFFEDNEKK